MRTEILELDQAVAKSARESWPPYIHIKKGYGANGAFFGGGGSNLEIAWTPHAKPKRVPSGHPDANLISIDDGYDFPIPKRCASRWICRALDSIKKRPH